MRQLCENEGGKHFENNSTVFYGNFISRGLKSGYNYYWVFERVHMSHPLHLPESRKKFGLLKPFHLYKKSSKRFFTNIGLGLPDLRNLPVCVKLLYKVRSHCSYLFEKNCIKVTPISVLCLLPHSPVYVYFLLLNHEHSLLKLQVRYHSYLNPRSATATYTSPIKINFLSASNRQ
jgi:hypothetical protein